MPTKKQWLLIARVQASEYRDAIVHHLGRMSHTPRELEKELKAKASQISRTLRELEEMKLVVCFNPEHRKNKIFGLTKLGQVIFNEVKKKFRAVS